MSLLVLLMPGNHKEDGCASQGFTSLTFISTSSENLECLGSISSVLSSAVVSILGFQNGPESSFPEIGSEPIPKTVAQAINLNENLDVQVKHEMNPAHLVCYEESNPVDFDWLRERCDNDDELVLEVLRSFCEQGQAHIVSLNTLYNSTLEPDSKAERLTFHAVSWYLILQKICLEICRILLAILSKINKLVVSETGASSNSSC